MPRLMDRILTTGIDPLDRPWTVTGFGINSEGDNMAERTRPRSVIDVLRSTSMEVIVIDNVADYFFTTSGKNPLKDWKSSDFPLIGPPFEQFWIEFQRPVFDKVGMRGICGGGIWFQAVDLTHIPDDPQFDLENFPRAEAALEILRDERKQSWGSVQGKSWNEDDPWTSLLLDRASWWAMAVSVFGGDPDPAIQAMVFRRLRETGVRWVLIGTVFAESRNNVIGPIGTWLAPIGDNGGQAMGLDGALSGLSISDGADRFGITDVSMVSGMINPALLGISFMHTKGTQRKERDPNNREPKLAKAYVKRHKRPMVRYKVLEVEAFRPRPTEGNGGGGVYNGRKVSLHIRRGYFGDYRERGLFGKKTHRGVYWFEAAVRGSAEAGVSLHDYTVSRERQERG